MREALRVDPDQIRLLLVEDEGVVSFQTRCHAQYGTRVLIYLHDCDLCGAAPAANRPAGDEWCMRCGGDVT